MTSDIVFYSIWFQMVYFTSVLSKKLWYTDVGNSLKKHYNVTLLLYTGAGQHKVSLSAEYPPKGAKRTAGLEVLEFITMYTCCKVRKIRQIILKEKLQCIIVCINFLYIFFPVSNTCYAYLRGPYAREHRKKGEGKRNTSSVWHRHLIRWHYRGC